MSIPGTKTGFPPEAYEGIIKNFIESLSSGKMTLGPYTQNFEERVAQRVNVRRAVACSSSTAALEMALKVIGVKGKKVLLSALSNPFSVKAVKDSGGIPVLCDVGFDGFLSTVSVRELLADGSVAVAILSYVGIMPNSGLDVIVDVCKEQGVLVIEDASHCFGATRQEKAAGSFGDIGCFSFSEDMPIQCGSGGMLVTNNEDWADKAEKMRDLDIVHNLKNVQEPEGSDWRITEAQAIMGISQVMWADDIIKARQGACALLGKHYEESSLRSKHVHLLVNTEVGGIYYKYMMMLPDGVDKESVCKYMSSRGVEMAADACLNPVHMYFPNDGAVDASTVTGAKRFASQHICLPFYADMSDAEAYTIMHRLEEAVRACR